MPVAFREDTGFFNANHYAAGADTPPAQNVFEVPDLAYSKLVEAPWGFKETRSPFIVFLSARGDVVSLHPPGRVGRLAGLTPLCGPSGVFLTGR